MEYRWSVVFFKTFQKNLLGDIIYFTTILSNDDSLKRSGPDLFSKKAVLSFFFKIQKKTPVPEPFSSSCRPIHSYFSVNFSKFVRKTFFRTLVNGYFYIKTITFCKTPANSCLLIFALETNIRNCACTNSAVPVSIKPNCAYSSGVALQAYYLITAACQITLVVLFFYDIIV